MSHAFIFIYSTCVYWVLATYQSLGIDVFVHTHKIPKYVTYFLSSMLYITWPQKWVGSSNSEFIGAQKWVFLQLDYLWSSGIGCGWLHELSSWAEYRGPPFISHLRGAPATLTLTSPWSNWKGQGCGCPCERCSLWNVTYDLCFTDIALVEMWLMLCLLHKLPSLDK